MRLVPCFIYSTLFHTYLVPGLVLGIMDSQEQDKGDLLLSIWGHNKKLKIHNFKN